MYYIDSTDNSCRRDDDTEHSLEEYISEEENNVQNEPVHAKCRFKRIIAHDSSSNKENDIHDDEPNKVSTNYYTSNNDLSKHKINHFLSNILIYSN